MTSPHMSADDRAIAGDPSAELLAQLAGILAPNALLVGDAIDTRYQEDMRRKPSARPRFVMRPGSTTEVAACLATCNAFAQPLAVQGGRTGLSGAHRIREGEAVLSLERMTGVDPVDRRALTISVQAGAPLQVVQEAAEAAGCLFGVDIGARGTATIGGNIATNSGGIRVLRYGMFRQQVIGLETVLADGTILSSLRGLEKDNTGYNLNQLFIGSEGTLGVVTRALLRLHPKPAAEANALLAVASPDAALQLLERLRATLGLSLSAFEIMMPEAYDGVVAFLGIPRPIETRAPAYILAEAQSFGDTTNIDAFTSCLMEALEDGLVLDAIVSQSEREFRALWTLRDAFAEYVRSLDHIAGLDISIPMRSLTAFLDAGEKAVQDIDPKTKFILFGHLGDGNLHYVISTPEREAAADRIYHLVAEHGGSISAEHGIGIDKKPWLALSRSDAEIAAMRRLKAAFDPNGILCPGRIFD